MPGGALNHVIVDVFFEFGGGGAQERFVDVKASAQGADMESEDAGGDEAVSVSASPEVGKRGPTPHSAVAVLLAPSQVPPGAMV